MCFIAKITGLVCIISHHFLEISVFGHTFACFMTEFILMFIILTKVRSFMLRKMKQWKSRVHCSHSSSRLNCSTVPLPPLVLNPQTRVFLGNGVPHGNRGWVLTELWPHSLCMWPKVHGLYIVMTLYYDKYLILVTPKSLISLALICHSVFSKRFIQEVITAHLS